MTPSGHMVVAEEAEPTALVCEPKPGQTRTSLVFDYEALDCLPPPAVAPPELREESGNSLFFVIVLVPILAVLFLVAAVLTYRNRLLSRHLYDMRTKGMKLDPQAFNIDLDSPLTKVTKYLGSIAGNRHFLLRMLFPKTELAKQVSFSFWSSALLHVWVHHVKEVLLNLGNTKGDTAVQELTEAYVARSWIDHFATEACDKGGCSGVHDSVPATNLVMILSGTSYRIYTSQLYICRLSGAVLFWVILQGCWMQLRDELIWFHAQPVRVLL